MAGVAVGWPLLSTISTAVKCNGCGAPSWRGPPVSPGKAGTIRKGVTTFLGCWLCLPTGSGHIPLLRSRSTKPSGSPGLTQPSRDLGLALSGILVPTMYKIRSVNHTHSIVVCCARFVFALRLLVNHTHSINVCCASIYTVIRTQGIGSTVGIRFHIPARPCIATITIQVVVRQIERRWKVLLIQCDCPCTVSQNAPEVARGTRKSVD